LIYAYLGGVDRGFVDVADIERLFSAEMPKTISRQPISKATMDQIR